MKLLKSHSQSLVAAGVQPIFLTENCTLEMILFPLYCNCSAYYLHLPEVFTSVISLSCKHREGVHVCGCGSFYILAANFMWSDSWSFHLFISVSIPLILTGSDRRSLWGGDMSHMGCILMMMPTVMPRVFALSAHTVPGMVAFPITCGRLRM